MTLIRHYRDRTMSFECDQCGEEFDTDTDDFHDALAEAKDNGWKAQIELGEWQHFCENCA